MTTVYPQSKVPSVTVATVKSVLEKAGFKSLPAGNDYYGSRCFKAAKDSLEGKAFNPVRDSVRVDFYPGRVRNGSPESLRAQDERIMLLRMYNALVDANYNCRLLKSAQNYVGDRRFNLELWVVKHDANPEPPYGSFITREQGEQLITREYAEREVDVLSAKLTDVRATLAKLKSEEESLEVQLADRLKIIDGTPADLRLSA